MVGLEMPACAKCLVAQLAHFGVSNGDIFGLNPPSPNDRSIFKKKKKIKRKEKEEIPAHQS